MPVIDAAWFLWNIFNNVISSTTCILYNEKSKVIVFTLVLDELKHGNKAIINTKITSEIDKLVKLPTFLTIQ